VADKLSKHKRARDAGALLAAVADALNGCEQAGMVVRLRHGIVMTREGYVLPLGEGKWGARTMTYTEFGLIGDDGDGDD
jgi:hypothetical protein